MYPRLIILFSFVFLLFTDVTIAGDGVPNWLRQAASANAPTYEKDVPAVVLHDEQQVSLSSEGK
ncbi:MAG TPA: hypothetical protein VGD05_08420, partial [Pyrinomonadaceae bacterium]